MPVSGSYRNDPLVPPFDDSQPLIIFDGHCVLCSFGVQWILKRDPNGSSKFAAIQTPVPTAIYNHYGLDSVAFDTFMVLVDGVPHTKWSATLAAAQTMPPPWRWLGTVGRVVPTFAGDRLYDWVQRNRFKWFGRREVCHRGDAKHADRFL
jgi:predicted DCC family thiol-disulfide oxidoreductase YuxK